MNEKLKMRETKHNAILQGFENAKKESDQAQAQKRNQLATHYKTRSDDTQLRTDIPEGQMGKTVQRSAIQMKKK